MNKWYTQYLPMENLFYLIEVHPDDGIVTELFYGNKPEMNRYIIDNNIKINKDDE